MAEPENISVWPTNSATLRPCRRAFCTSFTASRSAAVWSMAGSMASLPASLRIFDQAAATSVRAPPIALMSLSESSTSEATRSGSP